MTIRTSPDIAFPRRQQEREGKRHHNGKPVQALGRSALPFTCVSNQLLQTSPVARLPGADQQQVVNSCRSAIAATTEGSAYGANLELHASGGRVVAKICRVSLLAALSACCRERKRKTCLPHNWR